MTITDLDEGRWAYLQANVQAEYEIPEDATRVCLTFTYGEQERHVEMSMSTLIGLLMGMGARNIGKSLNAFMTKVSEGLKGRPDQVRQDCAFCHRERSPKDDNHADNCPYWTVGPGSIDKDGER